MVRRCEEINFPSNPALPLRIDVALVGAGAVGFAVVVAADGLTVVVAVGAGSLVVVGGVVGFKGHAGMVVQSQVNRHSISPLANDAG